MQLLNNFWLLFMESAPYLLVGLVLAGIIRQMIPDKWINSVLGKDSSVVTAALIGTPLPLCSCSVIPTALGIRRAGATKASTSSFMVATPETGVDSISITYALMGPVMAIARPIAAISSAIVAGSLVQKFDVETPPEEPEETTVKSCCGSKNVERTLSQKIRDSFSYGFGKLLSDFMDWLLVGLVFAALIKTFVPDSFFLQYGQGITAMLVVVLISIPMYICATASTPIAAGLMLSGFSPGAALVFMLTGPATNVATLMVIYNELGKRSLIAYLVGVVVTAIVMGLGLDALIDYYNINIMVQQGGHGEMTSLLYQLSAVVLVILMLRQYWYRFKPAN
ncbi:MAG: SO_0444 family Cu/Zn efflux transporter [Enterobacterales bacterium]|nr:SO_0444 family Cu/Zn efflux transporter [Enterobacterales bacterium]